MELFSLHDFQYIRSSDDYVYTPMDERKTVRVGKRGTLVIPADLRRAYGLTEDSLVIVEPGEEGLRLRPAVAMPIEQYTPERKAEFLLSNAVDEEDYRQARETVEEELGLEPDKVLHKRPDAAPN